MDRLEELQEQHMLLKEEIIKIELLIYKEQIKIAKENNHQIKKTCNNDFDKKTIQSIDKYVN